MLKKLLITIAIYAALPAAGVLIWLYASRTGASEPNTYAAVRFVLLAECAVIGLFAPFFYFAAGHSRPITHAAAALCRPCGMIAASSILAASIAVIAGAAVPWAPIVKTAFLAVGFAVLTIGFGALAKRLIGSAPAGLLAAYVLAAVMLGTVFYANPAVSAAEGSAKVQVIQAAVLLNPMLVTAGSAIDYDMLLSRRAAVSLYDNSLIGPDHLYRYPRWWTPGLAYFIAGALLLTAASARLRRIPHNDRRL